MENSFHLGGNSFHLPEKYFIVLQYKELITHNIIATTIIATIFNANRRTNK